MGRHKVRDQVLPQAVLLVEPLVPLTEALVRLDVRLAHAVEHVIDAVFRGDLELAADVVLDEVGEELGEVLKEFAFAKGQMSSAAIENAFMMPVASLGIECGLTSIMNVEVPQIKVEERKSGDVYPYAFSAVTSEADYSVRRISAVISKLVALAEIEKQTAMLADEIEKNKRRVNALEYVMIPQLEETIHYIAAKLDENERASITRLMKVKSMIADRSGN